jgi:hypothetical protein
MHQSEFIETPWKKGKERDGCTTTVSEQDHRVEHAAKKIETADEKERNTTTMMKMTPDDRESSLQRQ